MNTAGITGVMINFDMGERGAGTLYRCRNNINIFLQSSFINLKFCVHFLSKDISILPWVYFWYIDNIPGYLVSCMLYSKLSNKLKYCLYIAKLNFNFNYNFNLSNKVEDSFIFIKHGYMLGYIPDYPS